MIGSPHNEDEVLNCIANSTGCTVASVAYRLAPQFPYPVAVEDCIDAAEYLLQPESTVGLGRCASSAGSLLEGIWQYVLRSR